MTAKTIKKFPLAKTFTLLENGPVVIVTTRDGKKNNAMTISWTSVLDFTPRFSLVTGAWNHSYHALVENRECVLAIPAVDFAKTTVQIGSCSGAYVDKFAKFKLTALAASSVSAPLIAECFANIECRIIDHIAKHNLFILKAVKTWVAVGRSEKRFFHAVGDGHFIADGERLNFRRIMRKKLPLGV